MHVPIISNISAAIAATNATLFKDNAARKVVIPVPKFAPTVYGYICSNVKISSIAKGIIKEVVIEELCTIKVKRAPVLQAVNGVWNIVVFKFAFNRVKKVFFKIFNIKMSISNTSSMLIKRYNIG